MMRRIKTLHSLLPLCVRVCARNGVKGSAGLNRRLQRCIKKAKTKNGKTPVSFDDNIGCRRRAGFQIRAGVCVSLRGFTADT